MSNNNTDTEDTTTYKVVVNHEDQYSVWPADKENPHGWQDVGKTGLKPECLAYIKDAWTDMRPLSLRKSMEELAKNPPPATPSPKQARQKSLVDQLCESDHPVEVNLRPENTTQLFKEAIDRNYINIKFTDTAGGTELEIGLDPGVCDFSQADFTSGTGTVHIEGSLTLDYSKVRCIADINIETFAGRGRLLKADAAAGNSVQ